jgi:hypothetical protein
LTDNCANQSLRQRRPRDKLCACLVQPPEQRTPGRIDTTNIANGNNKRAIADRRRSSAPRLFQLSGGVSAEATLDFEAQRRSPIVNVDIKIITPVARCVGCRSLHVNSLALGHLRLGTCQSSNS